MKWLRIRHEESEERAEQATAERIRSEERLAEIKEYTTDPLIRRGEQNQFAEIIRRSLHEGGRGRGRHEGRTA